MKERILICDKQTEFVMALEQELNKTLERSQVEVQAFNDVEKLLLSCREKDSRAAFIGEQFLTAYETEKLLAHTDRIIYLTEERRKDGIFKYRPMSILVKEIIEKLMDMDEDFGCRGVDQTKGAYVIGLYSPVRGLLQSRLGLTLGQILASEKKVLYLNFEAYSGMEYLMQKEFSHGLTDLFFHIASEEDRLAMRMETIVEKVGKLDYIPPVFAYPDLEEFGAQGIKKLIERISSETEYETLILDIGQISGIFSLLMSCDRILCPYEQDPLAQAKVDEYENMLEYLKLEAIKRKSTKFELPTFSRLPREVEAMTQSELGSYIRTEVLAANEEQGENLSQVH